MWKCCRQPLSEMTKPIVSVIVPVYNGERYLAETLESILGQTLQDFELLVVDDGSSDESARVIRSFDDPRIVYVSKRNEGLAATLNFAIERARADVIARIDQDDVAMPTRLEEQYQAITQSHYDCVFCNLVKFGSTGSLFVNDKVPVCQGHVHEYDPDRDGCIIHSTLMAKKEALQNLLYRHAYYPADDWDLSLRLSESYKVGVLASALVGYRIHLGANTYAYFLKMQSAMRWANVNHRRRESGLPELSLEAYNRQHNSNWYKIVNRWRKDYGKLFFRKAGDYYLNGYRFKPLMFLALGFLFSPIVLGSRILRIILRSCRFGACARAF